MTVAQNFPNTVRKRGYLFLNETFYSFYYAFNCTQLKELLQVTSSKGSNEDYLLNKQHKSLKKVISLRLAFGLSLLRYTKRAGRRVCCHF